MSNQSRVTPSEVGQSSSGRYVRPLSLSAALEALTVPASVMAGGTDLVLMRNDGLVPAERDIVDIKRLAELRGAEAGPGGALVIGAATTLREVASAAATEGHAIADGAALVGGWQTRGRGTIGGNICRASPAGDCLPGVLVMDAQLELTSLAGSRIVDAADFFTAPGRTILRESELLTRIHIPPSAGGSAYVRFTYRLAMDLAVVGAAAHVDLDERGRCSRARIALGAAAPTPVLAIDAADSLLGTSLEPVAIDRAADLVLRAARPIDDGRGTRRHRLKVLPVLAARAIAAAADRARSAHR